MRIFILPNLSYIKGYFYAHSAWNRQIFSYIKSAIEYGFIDYPEYKFRDLAFQV